MTTPTGPESSPTATDPSRNILVVDDEPFILELATRMLKRAGWNPTCVGSGEQAVSALRRDPNFFRYVLLDVTMPGMDGVQTLKMLRDIQTKLPILLMSGYSLDHVRDGHWDLSITGFLGKPFRPESLLGGLEAISPRS